MPVDVPGGVSSPEEDLLQLSTAPSCTHSKEAESQLPEVCLSLVYRMWDIRDDMLAHADLISLINPEISGTPFPTPLCFLEVNLRLYRDLKIKRHAVPSALDHLSKTVVDY